jgi:hypothetical protein
MKNFLFWQKWLFIVALFIAAFGVMLALFNSTVLFRAYNAPINVVFWESAVLPPDAKAFQQWIYGVLGATVAGWGVFLAFIAHYPFKKKEKWAWNGIAAGIVLWFLIDTSLSLHFKVYFNAAFNSVVCAAIALPLLFTRKAFIRGVIAR